MEFERLCSAYVQDLRDCLDYFERCRETLQRLLAQGAASQELAPNMLPYQFLDQDHISEILSEADSSAFGQLEGHYPIIMIDASGAVGAALGLVRQGLKRMLYSFVVAKSQFNMISFTAHGRAKSWTESMVPPVAQALREAEEWLDTLKPLRKAPNFLDGLHLALAHPEADSVHILTSGLSRETEVGHVLKSVRSLNCKGLPLHVIGVDCEAAAELELRQMAAENNGRFRRKSFQTRGMINVKDGGVVDKTLDTELSIGGQLSILEVLREEQALQETAWLEEQKCAHRLLLSTAGPVPGLFTTATECDNTLHSPLRSVADSDPGPLTRSLLRAHSADGSVRVNPWRKAAASRTSLSRSGGTSLFSGRAVRAARMARACSARKQFRSPVTRRLA